MDNVLVLEQMGPDVFAILDFLETNVNVSNLLQTSSVELQISYRNKSNHLVLLEIVKLNHVITFHFW